MPTAKKKGPTLHFNKKKTVVVLVITAMFVVGLWNTNKSLPPNLSKVGEVRSVANDDVIFLSDETFMLHGERQITQTIFNYVVSMIEGAEDFIVVDMFLWNSFGNERQKPYRYLSTEVSQALIQKKKQKPSIKVVVISDPINTSYGGHSSAHFEAMKEAGIDVIFTELPSLRDSNPVYSSFWRMFVQPVDILHSLIFNKEYTFRVLPSILGAGENVTARSYLHLLNFKANHRKLIVADSKNVNGGKEVVSLVSSANPHDGSSAHSNVAVVIKQGVWRDILQSERGVIDAAGKNIALDFAVEEKEKEEVKVTLVTEGKIRARVLQVVNETKEGDSIKLFMFYLSDFKIISALKEAARRGVTVAVILDPNKDAFGREKNGVPNRPVASELLTGTEGKVSIRWCATNGEQCHTKLLIVNTNVGQTMLLGSANYTRRNVGDYNLESNIIVSGQNVTAIADAEAYFERAWTNADGKVYTSDYASFEDNSLLHTLMWRVMESTGLGTF